MRLGEVWDVFHVVVQVSGAGAVVAAAWCTISHMVAHKHGRVPAMCLSRKLDRTRYWAYLMLGGLQGAGIYYATGLDTVAGRVPLAVFGIGSLLVNWGTFRMWRMNARVAKAVVEHRGRYVEAATGTDTYGGVLWEKYVEVAGHTVKLDETGSGVGPGIRGPANERAEPVIVLVRGDLVEDKVAHVHIFGRWLETGPAERGTLDKVAARERI